MVKLTRGCYSDPPIFALFVPAIFRIFFAPLVSTSDKIIAASFVALVAVICILQVIIANKNREIRRLHKDRDSLVIATPPKHFIEHGKKNTKYSQKGDGVDNN